MKIIFLDFDGVLLPLPANGNFERELEPNEEAVKNLNLLYQLTGARVVVTSSWRNGRTERELGTLLAIWGFNGPVYGKTSDNSGEEDRKEQINRWLHDTPAVVESFVILDDDRTDLESLANYLVSPKPDVGLQYHDVVEALRILTL